MATYSKDFIVKNGLQVGGHIIPDGDETYDLGSSSKKFRDLYLSAGTIYLGNLVLKDNGDGTMATYESDGVTAASVQANAVDIDYDNSTSGLSATNVKAAIDEIVAEDESVVKTLLNGNLDSSIIPSADITYDLGSPTKQWRDVYVGPGSLYLNGTKVLEDDSGTLKFHADPAQSLSIETSTTGSTSIAGGAAVNITTSATAADIALTPTGDIELNADVVIGAGQALTTSNGSALTVNSNLDLGSNTVTAATFYGNLTGNISASSGTTTMNNLVVDGNLTVGGTTTTVNTETINLADNIITLNNNATGTPSENAGIEVERGDSANVTLRWNETDDAWEATTDGTTYSAILFDGDNAGSADTLSTARNIGGVSFDGSADINLPGVNATGNQDTSGNAATATALETARTISLAGDVSGSVSFDGTGNVSITTTIADDSHNHTIANVDGLQTALDAAFVSASASNDTITFTTAGGTTSSVSIADAVLSTEEVQDVVGGMVSTNTESGIAVTYDDTNGKLDFDVADTTITLDGDVSGSATMTNLGNVTITTTIADDSHAHVISNVDGLQAALDAKADDTTTMTAGAGLTGGGTLGSNRTFTVGAGTGITVNADDVAVDTSVIATKSYVDTEVASLVDSAPAALDTLNELAAALGDDANFSTTISNQIGTKLDSSHDMTLTLSGDASGSATFTNMGNATLSVTVADDSHNHTVANVDGLATCLSGKAPTNGSYSNNWAANCLCADICVKSPTICADTWLKVGGRCICETAGNYGTISVTSGEGTWCGYSIANNFVYMACGGEMGLYNDITNEWMLKGTCNGDTCLFHNGSNRIQTTSYGGYTAGCHCAPNCMKACVMCGVAAVRTSTVCATDINSTSDMRCKANIQTIDNAASKVGQLRGVNFDWKDSGKKSMGVIAQEVEEVLPEVVVTDDEGMKKVNYQAMVGVLIEAVKDLQARLDEHESKCSCEK